MFDLFGRKRKQKLKAEVIEKFDRWQTATLWYVGRTERAVHEWKEDGADLENIESIQNSKLKLIHEFEEVFMVARDIRERGKQNPDHPMMKTIDMFDMAESNFDYHVKGFLEAMAKDSYGSHLPNTNNSTN